MSVFSRRYFLDAVAFGLLLPLTKRLASSEAQSPELQSVFNDIRANVLQLINEEREVEKLQPVEIDELATRVATAHAEDMAEADFASHWGRDGLKPYQRYSFAGGYDATQENISAADNTWSIKSNYLKQDTAYLHVRMYQETPPNDGHRKAILSPFHTHVGIGLAVNKLRLRMVELFVSKYVALEPVEREVKKTNSFTLVGRPLNSNYSLSHIEVLFEPMPRVPELSWLREPRGYSLPDESRILKPILPPPFLYADRQPGVIEVTPRGAFRAPITLFKREPGIYTIVCWIRKKGFDKGFPATELCVRASE